MENNEILQEGFNVINYQLPKHYPKPKVNKNKLKGKAYKLENYNFLTPNAQSRMSWREYFNPYDVLNSKGFLHINIDYRQGGRSVNFYRSMFSIYYKNRKAKFLMIRRTEEDLKTLSKAFLTKCAEGGVDISEFKAQEDGVYHIKKTKSGKVKLKIKFINFIALNMVDRQRFNGVNPDEVVFALFDEFISQKGEYLINEPKLLLDIIQTNLRMRAGAKLILVGNNIDEITPYHSFFKIPPALQDYRKCKSVTYNGYTYKFWSQKKPDVYFESKLGGTDAYEITSAFDPDNYSYKGKPRTKQLPIIKKLSPDAKFRFNFYTEGWTFGVWEDKKNGKIIIHDKYNKNCDYKFTFNLEDSLNANLMSKDSVKWLRRSYYNNKIIFGDAFIKSEWIKALKGAETIETML